MKHLGLPSRYQDHMVLQREQPIPLQGTATPGATVAIRLAQQTASANASPDGHWHVTLPALPAGGPHELVVESGAEITEIRDVMIGDVWICAGQSNMKWPLSQSSDSESVAGKADLPRLRRLRLPLLPSWEPASDWRIPAEWEVCAPQNAGAFSAVGFHFARELARELGDIPIGLVETAIGGTPIEPWLGEDGYATSLALSDILSRRDAEQTAFVARETTWLEALARRDVRDIPAVAREWPLPSLDISAWPLMSLPGVWQERGLAFNGVVWFRREIEIPEAWAGLPLTLNIGACDKSDRTFFDGVEIGGVSFEERADAYALLRRYRIPDDLARPGRHVITVRVFSHIHAGGLTGPAEEMWLGPDSTSGVRLDGEWRYQVETNFGLGSPPNHCLPAVLFNGMVAPLRQMPCRGILWYQGESNAAKADEYKLLFPALISDWRRHFGQEHLPFLFVQLPNYAPGKDWAEFRDVQAEALRLPATGMAVTIDIGESNDIHPRGKREVGRRLSLLALRDVYHVNCIEAEGPAVAGVEADGAALRIRFEHAKGLSPANGELLPAFELAGADGVFYPAEATVEGEAVRVASNRVAEPLSVRYSWTPDPKALLKNGAGLPVAPFKRSLEIRRQNDCQ
jgi:sialate O-acetylesterase